MKPHQNHREYLWKGSWAHPRYLSQTLQGKKTGICIPDMFVDGPSEHQDFRTKVKLEGYQVEKKYLMMLTPERVSRRLKDQVKRKMIVIQWWWRWPQMINEWKRPKGDWKWIKEQRRVVGRRRNRANTHLDRIDLREWEDEGEGVAEPLQGLRFSSIKDC